MIWTAELDNLLLKALENYEINQLREIEEKDISSLKLLKENIDEHGSMKSNLDEHGSVKSNLDEHGSDVDEHGSVKSKVLLKSNELLKSKLENLKAAIAKPIPKSVPLELNSKSGNVKSRLENFKQSKNAKYPERVIAPMRTSVRVRAAAFSARASISNQYSNSSQGKFTPVPRRKHSVQSIVSNINEKKKPFEESPSNISFDISKTKKVNQV